MFSVKRNQIVIVMLVFMIAVAVYIDSEDRKGTMNLDTDNQVVQVGQDNVEDEDLFTNYEVTPEEPLENQGEVTGDDAQASIGESNIEQANSQDGDLQGSDPYNFVATIAKVENMGSEKIDQSKEVVATNNESKFATQRLDRASFRDMQSEELKAYVQDEAFSQDIRDSYAKKLIALEETMVKEDSIEREMSKIGFMDSFVTMGEDSVEITISKDNFEDTDIARIEDLAMRITKMQASKIHIRPFDSSVNH